MVLAESLVTVDMAVLRRDGSCSGEVSGLPRCISSEERPPSVDGRLGLGDSSDVAFKISVLSLLRSSDGRGMGSSRNLLLELEGRVGGEGGAWPPNGIV